MLLCFTLFFLLSSFFFLFDSAYHFLQHHPFVPLYQIGLHLATLEGNDDLFSSVSFNSSACQVFHLLYDLPRLGCAFFFCQQLLFFVV
jgi:hypothetical protein